MAEFSKEKQEILDKYVKLVNKNKDHPSRQALAKLGINRDKIRHHFVSLTNLGRVAKKLHPEAYDGIVDDSIFSKTTVKKVKDSLATSNTYFLTTAVTHCAPHEGFMSSIKNYEKAQQAITLILSASDPASGSKSADDKVVYNKNRWKLDPAFKDSNIVVSDMFLNDNLLVSSVKLSAKQIDPATSFLRIGQRNGSFIYASPKQRLKMTANSKHKTPHAVMTTGAVTLPDYGTARYMSMRTAYIANNDHVIGGIIVEKVNKRLFHFRQVQADKKGSFIDLGIQYNPDGTTKVVRPEALVLGDWHSGETSPVARKAFVEGPNSLLQVTKPKRIFVHDAFNGMSISHHEIKNKTLRAQRAILNQLDLYTELQVLAKDLEFFAEPDFVEEVVIVKSNHDEFLDRYLAAGAYQEDDKNRLVALKLHQAAIEGKNPLAEAIKWFNIKNFKKITFLEYDEEYKIGGVEYGAHGHKGPKGSRGSIGSMERSYGQSVTGHAHNAEILRGAFQVGTCSDLDPEYAKGPSDWSWTSLLGYHNGMRQLINVIEGEWRR